LSRASLRGGDRPFYRDETVGRDGIDAAIDEIPERWPLFNNDMIGNASRRAASKQRHTTFDGRQCAAFENAV
jgi:hypothetical protein